MTTKTGLGMKQRTGLRASAAALCAALAWAAPATGQAPAPNQTPPANNEAPHGAPPPAAPAPVPPVINPHAYPITANVTVTDQQLLNADKDQDNWLLHGRTYDNQRFSPLTQVNQKNVHQLR